VPLLDLRSATVDPDAIPRAAIAFGVSDAVTLDFHRHRKGELVFITRGVLRCETRRGLWVVPPQCALWIPAGVEHSVSSAGVIDGYGTFIERAFAPTLPEKCCSVRVGPLLRELLIRCGTFSIEYPEEGKEATLMSALVAEIAEAPVDEVFLPMPADARVRKVMGMMTSDPSDRATLEEWARRAGVGARTLNRVLVQQTGLSFVRWRQQLHVLLAIQWLSSGKTVQAVSADLGYVCASSFVTMFRKIVGTSPGRYMASRYSVIDRSPTPTSRRTSPRAAR
jgi:AraC-like DNA-binding protein